VPIEGELDVRLRPFGETDLGLRERFATDPEFSQPFEWSGFVSLRRCVNAGNRAPS
jgi:hypothetical protein